MFPHASPQEHSPFTRFLSIKRSPTVAHLLMGRTDASGR
ncbi:hypothetical protein FTUN_8661 [Frigoriglobus tundricola]|uniref:Uncharacterized protein n=1 Tax=Frigoriglobus tundricola TaxID=2774151 RepID=A0A6M5Z729_9BACT|nr:hypothetical protein FTUN_8661 [Frigoriglobus tundricola]